MHIFVTGATGFIGSAIVQELLGAGHQVLGLARSDASAASLAAIGAQVKRGDLNDLESLRQGAAASDGVIHTAFIHDFSDIGAAGRTDKAAVEAMGEVLADSDRPLVVTSGTAVLPTGRLVTEEDEPDRGSVGVHRIASEDVVLKLASQRVRASVLRLPPSVHGDGDHGFVPALIGIAREKGVSAYIGEGVNRWPAVHRLDAARLFRLAVEKAPAGARLHGSAEEGVPFREIAGIIGQQLDLPVVSVTVEEAGQHFGWMGHFAAIDNPTSSALTREWLRWNPIGPTLLEDLAEGSYFQG